MRLQLTSEAEFSAHTHRQTEISAAVSITAGNRIKT